MAGPAAAAGAKAAASAGGKLVGGGGGVGQLGRHAAGAAASRRRGADDGGGGGFGALAKLAAAAAGVGIFVVLLVLTPLLLGTAGAENACGSAPSTEHGSATSTVSTRFELTEPDPTDMPALEIATRIYLVGRDLGFGQREILTAFTVALVESGGGVTMVNVYGGDATSTGVFQQQNFAPWTARERNNVAAAAHTFYEQLRIFDTGQSIGELAADIQRPYYPYRGRYAEALPEAERFYAEVEAHLGEHGPVGTLTTGTVGCPGGAVNGSADLGSAETVYQPRAFKTLPAELMYPGYAAQEVDARIYDNVVWLLETYELRVTAAREGGHQTHGDGTAIDVVPLGSDWIQTAERAARDLGWIPECGYSGSRPACPLVPAIQFIGYNGYPYHGDPAHCSGTCPAHLHISWVSSAYGSCPGTVCGPNEWVKVFPIAVDRNGDPLPSPEDGSGEGEKHDGHVYRGPVSTFGPPSDPDGETAYGCCTSDPGIAINPDPPNGWNSAEAQRLAGKCFHVEIGNHDTYTRVIDKGPSAGDTMIDITGAAVRQMGLNPDPSVFPTGSEGSATRARGRYCEAAH